MLLTIESILEDFVSSITIADTVAQALSRMVEKRTQSEVPSSSKDRHGRFLEQARQFLGCVARTCLAPKILLFGALDRCGGKEFEI